MIEWVRGLNPKTPLTVAERKAMQLRILNNIDWPEDRLFEEEKKPSADRMRWIHYHDQGVKKAHVL